MHILSTYKTWLLYRRIVHTFHRNKMWIMFDVTSVSRCDVEEWPQSDTTYIHRNNVTRVLFIRQTFVKQDTTRGACSKRNPRLLQGTGITGEFWKKLLEPFVFVSTEICVVNVYNPLSSNVVSRIWGLGHTGPPPRAGPWNHPWEDHEKRKKCCGGWVLVLEMSWDEMDGGRGSSIDWLDSCVTSPDVFTGEIKMPLGHDLTYFYFSLVVGY